ncbi:hypothetical protein QFC19_002695 [Naganishia cerealis]|uniref:Uncharacterized protein n=1 Tax=Naganishia cerealis TaxID=610337 RepID=A0ACC2WA31_9TREE|nr:hypothetical protein QFC19_002695 [Naganishia cerealis]
MIDLASRTVAQLKEELQSKGVDVKGLKLKKDYIEKLQQALESESHESSNGEEPRKGEEKKLAEEPADSAKDIDFGKEQEGKHVSSEGHAVPTEDPDTSNHSDHPATDIAESNEIKEAKDDPTTAITKDEKDEQILGDADGDLTEKMKVAEEAGRQERIEAGGASEQTQTEWQQQATAEIKEEGQVAVEAAKAQAAPTETPVAPVAEESDKAADVDENRKLGAADKRKRSSDEEEDRDGKRSRLSPANETQDLPTDTPIEQPSAPLTSAAPAPSKKPTYPLPDNLSHVLYQATRALYISNLKRPLLTPDLKAWLIEQGTSESVQEDDVLEENAGLAGGVWLDGVKSHCYCIFKTVEIAISAASKIQGQVFPVDHGAPLTVEFVPEGIVESLVSQEKVAWENGRNKLVLEIKSLADNEWTKGTGFDGGDLSFELVPPKTKDGVRSGGGLGDLRPPRVPRPVELGGVPPAAPGFARPRPDIRPPPADAGWGARAHRADDAGGLQRTRTQPVLLYRESPKHTQMPANAERGGPRWGQNSGGWGNQQRNTGHWNSNRESGRGRPTNGRW